MRKWISLLLPLIVVSIIYFVLKNRTYFTQPSSLEEFKRNSIYTESAKPRIFLNISREPCPCETELKNNLPSDILTESELGRSLEFMQHQIRKKSQIGSIIIAPHNSPLQYPIYGVKVMPLKKSEIPGLELHASDRNHYKVSLSVKHGVLQADNTVYDEVEVVGQQQSTLTISSTRLPYINHLLSTVVYTSNSYHIEMTDLANFTFEEYMAIFPILIKKPKMPLLHKPSKDVNLQVTILTKTFLRYKELDILIQSIRRLYPDIKIIVADDSFTPQTVNGTNIEHYIMPPAKGWFAGRNLGVSQVTTKYFLWVDDDYVFLNHTRIERFVEIMEANPDLDVLGGAVAGDQFFFTFNYDEGDEEGGCLSRKLYKKHALLPGFPNCYYVDGVVNYFLARTKQVQRVGFDPFLKRIAHSEFFIDALGSLLIASCKELSVGHQKRMNNAVYTKYRYTDDKQSKLAHHYFKNHLKCIKY